MSPSSIDDLLVQHAAWMRGLARALVGEGWADDVVQEAWLAAHAHPPERPGTVRAWLARVVRNAALARRREELHRGERERAAARGEGVPGPAELFAELEAARELAAALESLAPEARELVHLRFFHGLAPGEIARARGENPATVRSRLFRALEELRARLDARHGGERRAWSAGLILFAGRPEPIAAAGGLVLLTGVLSMKVLVLAAAALVALSLGYAFFLRGDPAAAAHAPAPPAAAVSTPLAAPEELPELAAAPEPAARTPVASEAAPEPEPAASAMPPAPAHAPAILTARCLGPLGEALAGSQIELRTEPPRASPPAGASGIVRLEVPMAEDEQHPVAVIRSPGWQSRAVRVRLRAGELCELGEVELAPAARVTGWVRDPSGRGVEGARVWPGQAELPAGEAEGLLERVGHGWSQPNEDPELLRALAASSGPDGYFALDGVSAGAARLWAHKEGWRYGWSAALDVPAGRDLEGVEIALEPLRATDRIAGIVLDPQGEPVPEARLGWEFSGEGLSLSSSSLCDAGGRFEIVVWRAAPHDLRASDPGGRYATCLARAVAPGTLDIELRLAEKRWIELEVRDPAGNAVEDFEVAVRSDSGNREALQHAGGRARVEVPPDEFTVVVRGTGWRECELGPFDPAVAPASLACTLEPSAAAHGIVTLQGQPLAGAEVHVLRAVEPGRALMVDGFPALAQNAEIAPVRTGDGGAFRFDPRAAADYWLRVDAEGHAGAFVGPLALDPAVDRGPIAIEIGQGGRLELRVVHTDGSDAAGRIVGLTCGDGRPITRRAGPGGLLVLEDLVPGSWLVRGSAQELLPFSTTISIGDAPEELTRIPWTLEIHEGRTTSHVLELEAP